MLGSVRMRFDHKGHSMKIWNKLAEASVISRYGMKKDKKHVPLRVRRMRRSGRCLDVTAQFKDQKCTD